MKEQFLYILALTLVILLLLFFTSKGYIERASSPQKPRSRVKLFEGYQQTNLAWELETEAGDPWRGFWREIIPVNLKSLEIDLPKTGDPYDRIRRVEIWSMDSGDLVASSSSGFYNAYLEPELEFRANSPRYKRVVRVLPGERVKLDLLEPVKKIFLVARL